MWWGKQAACISEFVNARLESQASRMRAAAKFASANLQSWMTHHCSIRVATMNRLSGQIMRLRRGLPQAHVENVVALVAAVEAKDHYTERHSIQVSAIADGIARTLKINEEEREVLFIASLLHDIGKIAIPDAILTKPGPLTVSEYELVKEHPGLGAAILKPIAFLEREVPIVLHHHEWFNGRGYPAQISGEQIPLGARILQVADSLDAMLSPRCYKPGRSRAQAGQELLRCRGTQFDPHIADAARAWLQSLPDEPPSQTPSYVPRWRIPSHPAAMSHQLRQ